MIAVLIVFLSGNETNGYDENNIKTIQRQEREEIFEASQSVKDYPLLGC